MKTVSAIVPCYNYGIYLDSVINNIRSQVYRPSEIIVVDDGSTELLTIEKLSGLKHENVEVITTKNHGPAAARNRAFEKSKGDYLLLQDADDFFHESFVEKAVDVLNNNPRIAAVSSWTLCFGDEDYIWYPQGGTIGNFLNSTTCPACALVRREAWVESGGFDESFRVGYEDWDFWIRITKNNWLVYIIPELLFYYRQKPSSRVKETFARHEEIYKVIRSKHPDVFNQ